MTIKIIPAPASKPDVILNRLVDAFFGAEGELEVSLGLAPASYNPTTYELKAYEDPVNDEVYEKFQKVYGDLCDLAKEVESLK